MVIYVIATLLRPMKGMEAGVAPETTPLVQARSQKFAMGGAAAAAGTGVCGRSPSAQKFCIFFCEINFILRLF